MVELEKQVVELPGLRATAEELQRSGQELRLAKEVADKQREELELRVEGCLQMSAEKVRVSVEGVHRLEGLVAQLPKASIRITERGGKTTDSCPTNERAAWKMKP